MSTVDCMQEPWPCTPRGQTPLNWVETSNIAADGGIGKARINDADVRAQATALRELGHSFKTIARFIGVDTRRVQRCLKGVM